MCSHRCPGVVLAVISIYGEQEHFRQKQNDNKRFLSNFEFWCAGPPWLGEGLLQWPAPELPCLNKRCRQMARTSMNCWTKNALLSYPSIGSQLFLVCWGLLHWSTSFWPSNWGVYGTIPKLQSIGWDYSRERNFLLRLSIWRCLWGTRNPSEFAPWIFSWILMD